jgi:hypothetical protein
VTLLDPRLAFLARAVAVFKARVEARALLWHCLEFDLQEAVDVLQDAAERDGLTNAIGQDGVQAIMRDAFNKFRSG